MNKLIALCVFALIGSALADPVDDNNGETASEVMEKMQSENDGVFDSSKWTGMPEEQSKFRDYCLNAHGTVHDYVNEKLNGAAANIYSIMLTTATDVGREVLFAQKSTVEEGTKIIEQVAAENGGSATENQVEEQLEQGKGLFARVTGATKRVIGAIFNAARSTVFKRVEELRDQLGADGLKEKIENACMSIVTELEPKLSKDLKSVKASLKEATSPDQTKVRAGVTINNVGCKLTDRIFKVTKFCDILKVAGPAVYQLVGIN